MSSYEKQGYTYAWHMPAVDMGLKKSCNNLQAALAVADPVGYGM